MLAQHFSGQKYGYSYDMATGDFCLYGGENGKPAMLKGDDAFMLKKHLGLISAGQGSALAERTERVIEIHYSFSTRPCPMPRFVEE